MKKRFVLFAVISLMLVGCSQEEKTQTVTTGSSLHNYDYEMITEALKNHPDFPKLTINETSITEEVMQGENRFKVVFSWKTEINPHRSTIKKDPNNHTDIWKEDSSADYYIILMKEWETDKGNVRSYWKYKYIPQTKEMELLESEDNDNVIHSTT